MDAITLEAMEYEGLKGLLGARTRGPLGRVALEALAPTTDPAEVSVRRRRAAEALAFLREFRAPSPGPVDDPAEILSEVEPEGALIEPVRVSRLLSVIRAGLAWRDEIAAVRTRYPRLWDLAGAVPSLRPLLNDLAGKITTEGRLEDRASRRLAEIRGRIGTLEGRLQRQLRQYLERSPVKEAIQDEFVTVRSSRFVIPVKVEARKEVPGIIHGASSTGATVFVEPFEVVEANNELVTLREEEEAESARILREMGGRLRSMLPELRSLRRLLGEADLLAACAVLAEEFDCVPATEAEGVHLERARHPVLEAALRGRGGAIVPLDVELPAGSKALVLSGPNTGGKTVSLKTIGLLALMNQSGLLVPAASAAIPVFRSVLADVGDRQSITADLSTFSARMLRVAGMSSALEPPALVLLDEVGGGTDPEEEGALAVAIVDHFRRRGACVVATTHHGALKAWAEITEGVTNASMEFDEEALAPTHRLLPGIAGRSGGLEMAERFGIPGEILEEARSRLSESHRMVDAYLARLQGLVDERSRALAGVQEEQRRTAEERREAAERAAAEERALRLRYEEAVSGALAKIGAAAEEVERGLRDRAAALQLRSEARREIRRAREAAAGEIAPPAPVHPQPASTGGAAAPSGDLHLSPGSRVFVSGLSTEGVVQRVDRRRRTVDLLVRGKRMSVAFEDCEAAEGGGAPLPRLPAALPGGVTLQTGRTGEVPSELNLIGRTIEEARPMIEKFIDDAILAGHREVRIVHGHGSGRLRKAVAELLGDHPMVSAHRAADPRSGGTGATIAVLRD